jgi:S-DNA-T family DNA segregation ATPase FtsK/SpoIIIE
MSMVDSKTIIDQPGANQLIGRGDMLISKDGELTRMQCALIDTPEIVRLVDSIAEQQGYTEAYLLPEFSTEGSGDGGYGGGDGGFDGESGKAVKYDPKYAEIARDIVANGRFSISSIQQTHEVGFNRAARIVRQLERDGIVGPQIGSKPREIKYYDLPSLEAKLQELGLF